MSELTLSSMLEAGLWCVVQVTLLGLLALLVLGALSWLKRPLGSGPALSAILMVGLLTLFCFAPLPAWWNVLAQVRAPHREPTANASEAALSKNDSPAPASAVPVARGDAKPAINWTQVMKDAVANAEATPAVVTGRRDWRLIAASLAGASLGLGAISLLASLLGLVRLRRASDAIADPELCEQMDIFLAQASYKQRVDVRESGLVSGPATFGYFAPVILLPPSWRKWSAPQLSAVLAHEMAHIKRGDYLSHLLSQCCLALHFYHPLMHALVGRLRLDQELAADAMAAKWVGERDGYLRALAEVALSLPPRGSGLAVRSFVPSRGAWVRRIEMLKTMRGDGGSARRGWTVLWLGLMGVLATAVSTVRGPQGLSSAAIAQEANVATATPARREDFLTKYAPANTEMIFAIRPNEVMAHPVGKLVDVYRTVDRQLGMLTAAGLQIAKFEQVVVCTTLAPNGAPEMVVVARYAEADKIASPMPKNQEVGKVGGVMLYQFSPAGPGYVWGSVDNKTILMGPVSEITRRLSSDAASPLAVHKTWGVLKDATAAVIVSSEAVRSIAKHEDQAFVQNGVSRTITTPRGQMRRQLDVLTLGAPLWEETEAIALQLRLEAGIHLTLHTESSTGSGAKEVSDTLSATATLARNWLRTELQSNEQLTPLQIILGESARETLSKMEIKVEGVATTTSITVANDEKVAEMLPSLLISARVEAARQASSNNLKQIALAMHNYHDTYRQFPPAVLMGPDGKTPHSWRVALLPFIDQAELYKQYKFDEPWDSENNKKVLEKIPSIYQDPSEVGKTTNASYFAIAGANTILNSAAKGVTFADITDGTSNTVMVVEAKRDVPWTKPADLPVDTPAAALGYSATNFLAAFGDGSVRGIKKSIDPASLKWIFTRDDGNPVVIP